MKKGSLVLLITLMLSVTACGEKQDVKTNTDVEETRIDESQIDESANEETLDIENASDGQIVLKDGEMLFEDFVYKYNVNGDAVCICQYVGEGGDVVIPKKIDGVYVRYIITPAFSGCTDVTSIQIPDSVESIGREAFSGCTNLKTVNIPEGVTDLSPYVFKDCTSLENITLPDTVRGIEEGAFSGCTSLTSIDIPQGVMLWDYDTGIFSDCTSLKEVIFPTSIANIPSGTFQRSGLTEFVIPGNYTRVDAQAFADCNELKKLTVPSDAIFDMSMLYGTGVTIYGEAGSEVEEEAKSYDLTFVAINNDIDDENINDEYVEEPKTEEPESVEIPDEYIDWFYTINKVIIDGEEFYFEPTISDYFVIRGVATWDEKGFSWILQNQVIGSNENINDILFENLDQDGLSEEEIEALEFLVYGNSDNNHQTSYKSVFEINAQLFLDCIDILNESLSESTNSNEEAFGYWIAKLEYLEANYE